MNRRWLIFGALALAAASVLAWRYRGYLAPLWPSPARAEGVVDALRLSPGFNIAVYADVPGARSLAIGPAGTVFAGTRREGKVYAVRDQGGGRKAEVITLLSGLQMPNGVAVRDGDLYVAEVGRILRLRNIESALDRPPRPEVVAADYPKDEHHGWKFIAFGPDGLLYVPVGAPCNVCLADPDRYALISRLDVRTGAHGVFARGVRNTVGFDWQPGTGVLWFTDNGRDWLGDDRPPDELNRAPRAGLNFGFPFCHGRDIPDPEFGGGRDCSALTPPVVELGAHVAALGMRFYTGRAFPEHYRGGIFLAEHGSWNRTVPDGYRVMFVPLRDGEPGEPEVFADGWLRAGTVSGRPVDVLVMPDGSLLVSDDKGGRIYRITYRG